MTAPVRRLAIVGAFDGTHVAGSLLRAAQALQITTSPFDVTAASSRQKIIRSLNWRLNDRRSGNSAAFNREIIRECGEFSPDLLIVTGFGSVEADTIQRLKSLGILCVNISTDDPWNPVHRAKWRFQALSEYDIVFTPRRSNIQDIVALGCPRVEYLPFGYDEAFFFPPQQAPTDDGPDVLFVGGADQDRTAFLAAFSHPDARLSLAGAYWERHPAVPGVRLGALKPDALRVLTAAAKVNLCLVRRANRDGHVMRSFEIAACGGCMLVEDTAEHRDIFGADGDCVAYFTSPEEAQARARALLSDGRERERMSHAVVKTIQAGRHTYRDRLESILSIAGRVTTESIRHA